MEKITELFIKGIDNEVLCKFSDEELSEPITTIEKRCDNLLKYLYGPADTRSNYDYELMMYYTKKYRQTMIDTLLSEYGTLGSSYWTIEFLCRDKAILSEAEKMVFITITTTPTKSTVRLPNSTNFTFDDNIMLTIMRYIVCEFLKMVVNSRRYLPECYKMTKKYEWVSLSNLTGYINELTYRRIKLNTSNECNDTIQLNFRSPSIEYVRYIRKDGRYGLSIVISNGIILRMYCTELKEDCIGANETEIIERGIAEDIASNIVNWILDRLDKEIV